MYLYIYIYIELFKYIYIYTTTVIIHYKQQLNGILGYVSLVPWFIHQGAIAGVIYLDE